MSSATRRPFCLGPNVLKCRDILGDIALNNHILVKNDSTTDDLKSALCVRMA